MDLDSAAFECNFGNVGPLSIDSFRFPSCFLFLAGSGWSCSPHACMDRKLDRKVLIPFPLKMVNFQDSTSPPSVCRSNFRVQAWNIPSPYTIAGCNSRPSRGSQPQSLTGERWRERGETNWVGFLHIYFMRNILPG